MCVKVCEGEERGDWTRWEVRRTVDFLCCCWAAVLRCVLRAACCVHRTRAAGQVVRNLEADRCQWTLHVTPQSAGGKMLKSAFPVLEIYTSQQCDLLRARSGKAPRVPLVGFPALAHENAIMSDAGPCQQRRVVTLVLEPTLLHTGRAMWAVISSGYPMVPRLP